MQTNLLLNLNLNYFSFHQLSLSFSPAAVMGTMAAEVQVVVVVAVAVVQMVDLVGEVWRRNLRHFSSLVSVGSVMQTNLLLNLSLNYFSFYPLSQSFSPAVAMGVGTKAAELYVVMVAVVVMVVLVGEVWRPIIRRFLWRWRCGQWQRKYRWWWWSPEPAIRLLLSLDWPFKFLFTRQSSMSLLCSVFYCR